jgi:hypothetical protein
MSVTDNSDVHPNRDSGDVPSLRAGLAWFATAGLCLGSALGIAAILGASLSATAVRVAGSGALCGLFGLVAVSSSTLQQRSSVWRRAGVIGVLAAIVAAVFSMLGVWSNTPLSDTVTRILAVSGVIAVTIGFTGFLLTQQREEDPAAIGGLMVATLGLAWILSVVLVVDIISAAGSASVATGSASGGAQALFGGVSFARFVSVSALLTVLGSVLLPILRRAHPAYRGGPPTRSN